MAEIQIDMFEVQPGVAMLLQFDAGGKKFCVLADGGVKASGYKAKRVWDKLLDVRADTMCIRRRLDTGSVIASKVVVRPALAAS